MKTILITITIFLLNSSLLFGAKLSFEHAINKCSQEYYKRDCLGI